MQIKAALLCGLVLATGLASAQIRDADPDWKETEVPAAPSFDAARVLPLDMPPFMSVKLGIDPETIRITNDGIVRYVVVAQSPSGTVNATYEGIRCETGEVKVYARFASSKVWAPINNPAWRPLRDNQPSLHALAFARQGACDGRGAVTLSTQAIVKKLNGTATPASNK